MRSILTPLAFMTAVAAMVLVTSQPSRAATDPAAKCIDAKLKTAGQAAQKKLTCHSKAEKKGEAVDPTCLSKATNSLIDKFGKAEAKGGCLTEGNATHTNSFVDGLVSRAVEVLQPSGPSASKCTSKKLKAAGKRASKILKAHGKTVKKEDASKLGDDIAKAAASFSKDFTKGEGQGGCQTTNDTDRAGATVDAGLDAILADVDVIDTEIVSLASGAEPADTPGTGGVDENDYPNLVTQLGAGFNLNKAIYTRFYYQPDGVQPDAILILIPGFEGGALSFKMLAENMVSRALENGSRIEVWTFDRRGHQMEDLEGQDIAEATLDAELVLDWYYGAELLLPLSPELPGRRAFFHNAQAETAFMANWTNNVFSRDIDAVVEAARLEAKNQNVFLAGHSAGTGFTARYAATDFDIGAGVDAGYAKLRGLVLIEGGGGSSTTGTPPTSDELDLMEDKADGGLFFAVRDDAPRCVDGTACATNGDCAGKGKEKCVEPETAFSTSAFLNPRILAAGEITAMQAVTDPDTGEGLVTVDQGSGSAVTNVPDLAALAALGVGTAYAGLGAFLDDDGPIAGLLTFVATSLGAPGPDVGGLMTWQDITEGPMPIDVLPDNGPPPTSGVSGWGQEVEVTRLDRMILTFFEGGGNFTDWYYPSAGPGTTSGLASLDSSLLSVGRSRPDIENITEAANINIPVICVGGSNGLTPVPLSFVGFADSIGTCTEGDCDGLTPRVVDDMNPSESFPTLGDAAGGFEVFITEGIAHVDITTAEDDADNNVVGPLLDFIERNSQ